MYLLILQPYFVGMDDFGSDEEVLPSNSGLASFWNLTAAEASSRQAGIPLLPQTY